MNAPLMLPPHATESEQSILGALLIENAALDRISGLVSEEDFYREDHRQIFRVLVGMITAGEHADVVTVLGRLEERGIADSVGGLAYLGDIANNTPSTANIAGYAKHVRERAVSRRLIAVGDSIAAMATAPGMTMAQRIDAAQSAVMSVAGTDETQDLVGMAELTQILTADLHARAERDSNITGLATGFAEFDEMLGGLQSSDLIIVAGRPGMGKSTFAMNLARHAASNGHPGLVVSLEMPLVQLGHRLCADIGSIPLKKIRSGHMTPDEWADVGTAMAKIKRLPMRLKDAQAPDVLSVRAMARKAKRELGGLAFVVIDYLQLMSGNGNSRAEEIAGISRGLKALAKELDCPIVALSQLNRDLEKRPNKRPVVSDLRESGAIEQDADVIVFVYRDEIYNPTSPEAGTAEIIVGKHRNGELGTVRLAYQGQFTRFGNLAKDWKPSLREYCSYGEGYDE